MPTWVDREGLEKRYGGEFVAQLARRRDWDPTADGGEGAYVENETPERVEEIIELAISDAKEWILWKLSCCYPIKDIQNLLDEGKHFSSILRYHIKLTITMLKFGGDCSDCDSCKAEISELCNCSELCTDDGICIKSKNRSVFAVEDTGPSCMPKSPCCSCNNLECCCGS